MKLVRSWTLDTAVFADEIVGFHIQQAAEKFLKAWLVLWSEPYPLTHNLARLLTLLQEKTPAAAQFRDLNEYTAYAVQFRYDAMDGIRIGPNQPRRSSPAFGSAMSAGPAAVGGGGGSVIEWRRVRLGDVA